MAGSRTVLFGFFVFSLLFVALAVSTWSAVEPDRRPLSSVNVRGRLSGDDIPAEGQTTKTITFSIYDLKTGGTALWQSNESVIINNGAFNVLLGTTSHPVNPIAINWDPNKRYYLGIKVPADPEMTPRQELVAVPFAMLAKRSLTAEVAVNYDGGKINAAASGIGADIAGSFKTIYATAEGIGVEGNAYGAWGKGVWGKAFERGDGLRGENLGTYSIIGVDQAVGVKGRSRKGHGIYGKTEAYNKAGVYGKGNPAIEGIFGADLDYKGHLGAQERNSGQIFIRDDGSTSTLSYFRDTFAGVFGKSEFSYGALGCEISIESGGSGIYGVYGYTDGGSAAIRGESPNGVGVEGAGSAAKAGVRALNYGTGPALEIGKGWIKISGEAIHFQFGAEEVVYMLVNE